MTRQADMSDRVSANTTKVDRYNWKVKDGPGTLMSINKYDLRINPVYQRHLIHGKVLELSASWSWIACSVITVGLREGMWWVIDGQHRVMAAIRRADITELPCIVFELEDITEEARGFLNINNSRKNMTSVDRLRASAVAGDEPAKQFEALCKRLNLTLTPNGHNPGSIKSAGWGMDRMREDAAATTIVMELAAELCADEGAMVQAKLLGGLWYLHKNCEADLTHIRFRQRIKKIGARGLMDAALRAAAFYTKGGEKVWAIGMLEAINKGLRMRFRMRGDQDDTYLS